MLEGVQSRCNCSPGAPTAWQGYLREEWLRLVIEVSACLRKSVPWHYFVAHLKVTQHCKSTIFQWKKKFNSHVCLVATVLDSVAQEKAQEVTWNLTMARPVRRLDTLWCTLPFRRGSRDWCLQCHCPKKMSGQVSWCMLSIFIQTNATWGSPRWS